MSEFIRKELVYIITGIVAVIMFIDFFFGVPLATSIASMIRSWAVVISAMALAIGAVQLTRTHLVHVTKRTPGRWFYSAWLIFIFISTTILGLLNLDNPSNNVIYKWIFNNVYTSLSTTTYAITGFYIFSAAYRAFRARNSDAAILLIGGCLVILTNAPIGGVILGQIPIIGRWILDTGQVPATRTFLMVTAFGILFYGFKVLIGKERGYYSESGGN